MATRHPIVYVSGFLTELPPGDGVAGAVQPNAFSSPTLYTLLPGEIAMDGNTGNLVMRIGNLLWKFEASSISSYSGQLDFSKARNSHWIGSMI